MADLTFLIGVDVAGSSNQFYTNARKYFADAGSTIVDPPANGLTLEGVFTKLRDLKVAQGTVNLVSHANGFASMECPLTLASQTAGRRTMTVDDLRDALANKTLAAVAPGPAVITAGTRIVIYGCDVGRSEEFLRLLSGLFGDPGEVLAPRRLGLFIVDGTTVKYRQAQTWSLVRKPPLVIGAAPVPTGGWANYRTKFVTDAHDKFGRIAIVGEPVGQDRLKTMLTDAAQNATTSFGLSFFLEEGVDIFPHGSQTAAEAAASVKPRSNGDPITAVPKTALELDDTTVVTTISGTDAYPANPAKTRYQITVTVLAQVVDQPVLIAEGPNYRRVTTSQGIAPSPGPAPTSGGTGTGSGSGAGAANDELQILVDLLLADGAPQAEVDEMVALVPTGDATEGLATDVPADISDADDGIALLLPAPQGQLA
jgi:hypothetical protein